MTFRTLSLSFTGVGVSKRSPALFINKIGYMYISSTHRFYKIFDKPQIYNGASNMAALAKVFCWAKCTTV